VSDPQHPAVPQLHYSALGEIGRRVVAAIVDHDQFRSKRLAGQPGDGLAHCGIDPDRLVVRRDDQ
jgi:hypothetical protein